MHGYSMSVSYSERELVKLVRRAGTAGGAAAG